MSKLEIAAKGTLFAVAISLVTAGTKLIETDLYAGITVLAVGITLIIVWAFLIDRQARQAGEKAAEKTFERLKELERKRSCKRN